MRLRYGKHNKNFERIPSSNAGGRSTKRDGGIEILDMQKQLIAIKINEEEHTGRCKEMVRDGVWQVPVEDRPKGWQNMGVREPE